MVQYLDIFQVLPLFGKTLLKYRDIMKFLNDAVYRITMQLFRVFRPWLWKGWVERKKIVGLY